MAKCLLDCMPLSGHNITPHPKVARWSNLVGLDAVSPFDQSKKSSGVYTRADVLISAEQIGVAPIVCGDEQPNEQADLVRTS